MPITIKNIPARLQPYIIKDANGIKGSRIASMLREGEVCFHEHTEKPGHYVVAIRENSHIRIFENPPEPLENYFKPPRVPVDSEQLLTRTTNWIGGERDAALAFTKKYKLQGNELFTAAVLEKNLQPGELFLRASNSDPIRDVAAFNKSGEISYVKIDEHSVPQMPKPIPLSQIVKSGYFRPVLPNELVTRELSKYGINGESKQSLQNLAGKLRENEFFLHDNGTNGQQKFLCIRLNGGIKEIAINDQQLQEHFKQYKPVEIKTLCGRLAGKIYDEAPTLSFEDIVDHYTIQATSTYSLDQLKTQLKIEECCLRESISSPGQKILILRTSEGELCESKLSADLKTYEDGTPVDLKRILCSNEWHPVDTKTLNERATNQANSRPPLRRIDQVQSGLNARDFQEKALKQQQGLQDKKPGEAPIPAPTSGKK